MKTMNVLMLIILATHLISCDRNDNDEIKNVTVEKYIELLKSNQYDSLNLPELSPNDIPALIEYRNETQIITNFPHNPISSLYHPECKLGIYVLWTIESIRAISNSSSSLIMRFPSQNPILEKRNSIEMELVEDETSHEIAAKAYFNWWYSSRNLQIDPLKDTEYRWH